jgi:predicted lipoprotein with Yx(FWY)xxD motif
MSKKSFFNKPLWSISLIALVALVLAACQPAANAAAPTSLPPTNVPAPTATTAPAPTMAPADAMVNVDTDPKLGQILVGGNGMTLYVFTKDTADTSNCTGACAVNWPALKSQGSPQAGTGVTATLLGSAKLADGSLITTYNHLPLYFFAADKKPGDVNGQSKGGVWFVVGPDGKPIGMPAATTAPTAASAPAPSGATINVATDPTLGKILVDGKGMTLYMYTKDTPDTSNCTGGCLKFWPAFITAGNTTVGTGVDASLIGSAKLADGTMIVTYNHMPLYYFAPDKAPGDVKGQNSGTVWFVVGPDGKPIGMAPAAPAAAPTATAAASSGY